MRLKSEQVLMVFLKYPEPGQVKTRLAVSVGEEKAATIYRHMAEQVVRQTDSGKYQQALLIDPPDRLSNFQHWLGQDKYYKAQAPGALGNKLAGAFHSFFKHGVRSVIAIGSDCIDIHHDDVVYAFQKLGDIDAIIGPALDGGYYLLGLNQTIYLKLDRDLSPLFSEIAWSTPRVYTQTQNRLEQYGAKTFILPEKRDMDTLEDLIDCGVFV